jgi:hypothetical protein
MDIKDLDKKQLILLTLLITFVVSIATGIVTVSLMNQMPKAIPQTINNVIQRTIEKVTTVETPAKESTPDTNTQNGSIVLGDGDAIVSIYAIDGDTSVSDTANQSTIPATGDTTAPVIPSTSKELGQGIIISDVGLVLVDSSILTESLKYKVILNKTDFDATVLKKFTNGFSILKISEKKAEVKPTEENKNTNTNPTNI